MRTGTVFVWNNFPFPRLDTIIKPRWFIYLGETSSLSTTVFVYLCTTTTQLQDFESGGKRCNHDRHLFKCGSHGFDRDCILDFNERPFSIEETALKGHAGDIEEKGQLPDDLLRMIYKRIMKSRLYSPMILRDIHACLNKIGITGLPRP